MVPDQTELFTRDEVLGGLPAKRASTLLFAIESRTAQLKLQARQEVTLYLTAKAVQETERAFLQAIAQGRDLPIRPTIQDLEHYARDWAPLLAPDAGLRAALARLIGEKYLFTYGAVSQLRYALGLDDDKVNQAYARAYGQPLETIYATTITWQDRLQWQWAKLVKRLENLPPFWLAFMLTLPGAPGLLALPIVLASVGAIAGITLIVLFGIINMITVAALAEAVARSGTARFGLGFLGQLVQEYLGGAASALLSAVLVANTFLVLIIFSLGTSSTLADLTRLPAEGWIVALFCVCLYFLSRRSFNSTVGSTLLIVLISIVSIVIIPLLALPYFQTAYLANTNVPFLQGASKDMAALGAVIGIMLSTFFSHFLIASYGPVVLRRDPGARAWVWGSVAAILVFMLIACLWMIAVNGAIAPDILAKTTGTVLSPLADKVGSGINLLGSILVILSLGLACIQVSLGLYYQVQERLPALPPGTPEGHRRFMLSISPVVVAFLLAEWLSVAGSSSFANLLGTVSAMTLPLLGGVFPVLLLAATRRKGDFVPAVAYRWLGHPVVLLSIYLIFLGTIFVHGGLIWQEPTLRIFALVVGVIVLGVTMIMLLRGALDPRVVIELRQDQRAGESDVFNITANGAPLVARVELEYSDGIKESNAHTGRVPSFAGLRSATFHLPVTRARQLKLWVHKFTPEGHSESLLVKARAGTMEQEFHLQANGIALLPIGAEAYRVRLAFQ